MANSAPLPDCRAADVPPPAHLGPRAAASYTHGHHPSVLRSHGNRTVANSAAYLAPELLPGRHLLDVGSGPGTITADFARQLAPGRVTAVEATTQALALTRTRIAQEGLVNVDFVVGDAHALPLPNAQFDIVHAHQVLQHVADPVQALREMRRVCKTGGLVAARDADYAGFIWHPQLPELDHWMQLYQQAARANGGEPNAGRRLLGWAQQAGFSDTVASSSTWCLATPAQRHWWGVMWAERIIASRIAEQLVESELASTSELHAIAGAWRRWAAAKDGWMTIVHGEILCRV